MIHVAKRLKSWQTICEYSMASFVIFQTSFTALPHLSSFNQVFLNPPESSDDIYADLEYHSDPWSSKTFTMKFLYW